MISKKTSRQRRTCLCVPKNIWTVCNSVINNLGIDPPVINGNQIPLHRNDNSMQNTLNFQGMDT